MPTLIAIPLTLLAWCALDLLLAACGPSRRGLNASFEVVA